MLIACKRVLFLNAAIPSWLRKITTCPRIVVTLTIDCTDLCLFVCFLGVTTHCGCIFTARWRVLASSFSRFLDYAQRRTTVGRTPLDELSIRRRDFYLTTHNTHNRQISMSRWDSNPQSQQANGRRPKP